MGNSSGSEKRQAAGALTSVIREFDSLKNLFTSASLNTFIDLPFMLFLLG